MRFKFLSGRDLLSSAGYMFTELPLARSNHHKSKLSHEPVVMEASLTTRPHCDINIRSVSKPFLGGLMNYTKIYLEYEVIVKTFNFRQETEIIC